MLDDPVIGRVELVIHEHEREPLLAGNPHLRIGHQGNLDSVALRYPVDFVLHRTAIGIDKYLCQIVFLPEPEDGIGCRFLLGHFVLLKKFVREPCRSVERYVKHAVHL